MSPSDAPTTPAATSDREIVLTRTFDAPRSLVWQAWTDADHLVNWWGPRGFTTTYLSIDRRPGGATRFIMHGPDGTDYPNLIVFDEVVEPERLVYTHGTGEADDPRQFHVTVTFLDRGDRTELIMRMLFQTAAACETVKGFGAIELGYQTLDRLAEELTKMAA